MTIAYWCMLIVAFMPMSFAAIGKVKGGFGFKENSNPREFFANSTLDIVKRANWIQQNTFEAMPAFFAAVIIAHQLHAPQPQIDLLAMSFVVLRIVYGYAYFKDLATFRSLVWTAATTCVVGLFVISA